MMQKNGGEARLGARRPGGARLACDVCRGGARRASLALGAGPLLYIPCFCFLQS
jgi:hypothetical protein